MPPIQSIPGMPATPSFTNHPRHWNKKIWALVFGAIATVVVLTMFFLEWKSGRLHFSEPTILLSPSEAPLFQALTINLGGKTTSPILVEGLGTAVVTDMAPNKQRNYYLIANQSLTESNLYSSDSHNPQAGLSQRTFSHTTKFSLSYDPQSGAVAYVSKKGSEPGVITLLLQGTTTEKLLGEGSNPEFLKGGFFVTYQKGNEVLSVNVHTKETHTLFTIPEGGTYAVDGEGLRAVVYDPTTRTLQYFSLEGMTSASFTTFKKEEGVAIQRRILGISGDTLASLIQAEEGISITLGKDKPVFFGGVTAHEHSRLTIYHD
ncbi:MAG: hypothetical protein AAB472_03325 [Patescibacteria group bacterium]